MNCYAIEATIKKVFIFLKIKTYLRAFQVRLQLRYEMMKCFT